MIHIECAEVLVAGETTKGDPQFLFMLCAQPYEEGGLVCWDIPSGPVMPPGPDGSGETAEEAAIRVTEAESGLFIFDRPPTHLFTAELQPVPDVTVKRLTYISFLSAGEVALGPDHTEHRWLSLWDADRELTLRPDLQKIVRTLKRCKAIHVETGQPALLKPR